MTKPWALVLHGGAENLKRGDLTAEVDAAHRNGLREALQTGTAILEKIGTYLDAVEAAVRVLENNPLFNAGRGAVFNEDGTNELDAAIMDGKTLRAGAVAGVTRTRHPVSLARAVMEKSKHVMLIGAGADAFSRDAGLEQVEPSYFFTEERWQELANHLTKEGREIPQRPVAVVPAAHGTPLPSSHQFGTVGAVALDTSGNIAAATSTGGILDKQWGRVGDSPIIGAGTYASNASCAVSSTGTGEHFIRLTIARSICAFVECHGLGLQQAVDRAVQKELTTLGGQGGVIALTPDGHVAWSFNTHSMYRASAMQGNAPVIFIYKDEP